MKPWSSLLEPYPFFDHYKKYIEIDILGNDDEIYESWKTYVQVKMLPLYQNLYTLVHNDLNMPEIEIHPFPQGF